MQRLLVGIVAISFCVACTPATRQTAGAGTAVVGALSMAVGTDILIPCANETNAANDARCSDGAHPAGSNSKAGVPLLLGGLSLVVIGVVLMVGVEAARPPAPAQLPAKPEPAVEPVSPPDPWPALPSRQEPSPYPLDVQTACGLTERYLNQPVVSPSGILDALRVESCRGPVVVLEDRARLMNVYLRAASTLQLQAVTICFEHRADWIVASCRPILPPPSFQPPK